MPGNTRTCECGTCRKCYRRAWMTQHRRGIRKCFCGRCPDCKERDRIRGIEIDAWLAGRKQLPPPPMSRAEAARQQKQTANAAPPVSQWERCKNADLYKPKRNRRIPRADD